MRFAGIFAALFLPAEASADGGKEGAEREAESEPDSCLAETRGERASTGEAKQACAASEAGEAEGRARIAERSLPIREYDLELEPPGASVARLERLRTHPALELRPSASESKGPPIRWWTGAALGIGLGIGTTAYWGLDKEGYPRWGLSDWPDRFATDPAILDTNRFRMNYSFHTMAGTGYHLSGRTNDLSLLESAAWSLGASVSWEYVFEFRGKADINDLIFTTPAGVAMGEFAHKLGRLLHQGREGLGWDVARWTLGFPQTFTDVVTGKDSPRGPKLDHQIQLGWGISGARASEVRGGEEKRDTGALSYLRLSGTLSALPSRDRPGSGWRSFVDGDLTSLEVRLARGSSGRRATYLLSDTVLAGWRYADIAADQRRGKRVNVGSSVALRYHNERYGTWRDRLGIAHLPGLAVDAELWERDLRVLGWARLHADYGGVFSQVYPDWQSARPETIGISTVEEEGYYHAWGVSARLGTELSASRFRAGGSLFVGRYRPHYGLDEFRPGRPHHDPEVERENITVEQRAVSRVFDYELWLRSDLPRDLFVEVRAAVRRRREVMDDIDARVRSTQLGVELGTAF